MNQEEVIKRIYGKYYNDLERYMDEWGRIKTTRFVEFCNDDLIIQQLREELRLVEFESDGINYVQPQALDGVGPIPIPELTCDQEDFLDNMATKVMVKYFDIQQPMSWEDFMKIARLSYTQALAMLNVKENGLQELINKNGLKYKV